MAEATQQVIPDRGAATNGNVREVWLFGSRARGEAGQGSGVDLALALMPLTTHDYALGNYYRFESEWKGQLKAIVGRNVSIEPFSVLRDTLKHRRTISPNQEDRSRLL
jgi:predicted nucleotidyltransferase